MERKNKLSALSAMDVPSDQGIKDVKNSRAIAPMDTSLDLKAG